MTIDADPPEVWHAPGGRPWGTGHLILSAVLWFILSIAASAALVLAGLALDRALGWRARVGEADARAVDDTLATCAQATVILVACCAQARRCGGGNPRAWLGDRPIRVPLLLMVLVALDLAYVFGLTALQGRGAAMPPPIGTHAWWGEALIALVALLVGPLWEELLFRGWLWAGLRRQWSAVGTAAATSALWLACHLFGGWAQTLTLLPVAVLLSLARQNCGSLRASFTLHAFNNGASILAARLWLAS